MKEVGKQRLLHKFYPLAIRGSSVLLLCSKIKIEMHAPLPLAVWHIETCLLNYPLQTSAMFSLSEKESQFDFFLLLW